MTIAYIANEDFLGDLKRNDNLVLALNVQGIYGDTIPGWNLPSVLDDEFDLSICTIGPKDLGTVITWEVEDGNGLLIHGIVCADLEKGWEDDNYDAITNGLDEIYAKVEDTFVRPLKSTWLGIGKMRAQGEHNGDFRRLAAAIANSKAEVGVHYL